MDIAREALPNARPVEQYLEFLACPNCKSSFRLEFGANLRCLGCNKVFSIKANIPNLLPASLLEDIKWLEWKDMDDTYQECYRAWSREEHLAARQTYDAFYDWCNVRDVQSVSLLDVGGGNGTSRVMYWKYPEKIDYFNVDPHINFLHPFHLDLYSRMKEIDFPYILGVGECLPLKSNTFDICITTAAVDHWNNPIDVFHEIYRCLKPQKKLYIMISKHISPTETQSMVKLIYEHYRTDGFFALSKKLAKRIPQSLPLKRKGAANTHMHHFRSLEQLTRLLYMFKIIRAKEAKEGNQFYIECLRE